MRPRFKIREQLYRDGQHDSDELRELQLEILLDIRDVLVDFYNRDTEIKIEYDNKDRLVSRFGG